MASTPDAAAWQARLGEWNSQRFLGLAVVPPTPPSIASTGNARYFGAR
jgi:hypothetical protein